MNKRAKSNSIRIIAGDLRGSKIQVNDAEGLRPTTDRVRETLFNWLNYKIVGSNCLDLFAGSGALGLECISRGANNVIFVESNNNAVSALENTIRRLKIEGSAQVHHLKASQFLESQPAQAMDIVFLDPPFKSDILEPAIDLLSSGGWLHDNSIIYIEQSSQLDPINLPSNWTQHRQGKAGKSAYSLYYCST